MANYEPPQDQSDAGKPITIIEVGNQVLAPLMAGLMFSWNSNPMGKAFADNLPKIKVPMGTDMRHTASFTAPELRRNPDADDEWDDGMESHPFEISPYTKALALLHDQLLEVGLHTGDLINHHALPNGIGQDFIKHVQADLNKTQEVLSSEKMPFVSLVIPTDDGKNIVKVNVPNVPIGKQQKSLAQVMMVLGYAAETVKGRSGNLRELMLETTGGFVETLPPIQMAVYRHLSQELTKQGYDGDQLLQGAGCDLNRDEVRKAFDMLLPYAEIYELGCQLKGDDRPDGVQKAFRKMRQYCSASSAAPRCRDGYECAILLEGMLDYAIRHAGEHEQSKLTKLKEEFTAKAGVELRIGVRIPKQGMGHYLPPTPTVSEVIAWPQSQKIIAAFGECYANDLVMEREQGSLTDKAWRVRVRSELPVPGGPLKP